jgi:hypothetical protein
VFLRELRVRLSQARNQQNLPSGRLVSCLAHHSILKMEAGGSSEMSVNIYKATRRNISKDRNLHRSHSVNLKYHTHNSDLYYYFQKLQLGPFSKHLSARTRGTSDSMQSEMIFLSFGRSHKHCGVQCAERCAWR